MKKIVFLIGILILSFPVSILFAADETKSESAVPVAESRTILSEEEINLLEMRIKEIREMDKSELTAEERQELRTELQLIKEEARQPWGGFYISITALLVVILLILLLR
jgi:hypothetical protein